MNNLDIEYTTPEQDDYDCKIFSEYEAKKNAGKVVTHPIEDLWKELDLIDSTKTE